MESFNLITTNQRFQKSPRKLWTCQYPNGSKGQVDFIIVRKKWVRSISNVEPYSSTFESINSDHRAVSAQVKLRLRAPKKKSSDFRKINFRSLSQSKELSESYTINVHNRFSELTSELSEEASVQQKYDCLIQSCSEVGKSHLPKKKQKKWSNLHLSDTVSRSREILKKALDSDSKRSIDIARENLQQAYKTAEECYISTQVHIIENTSFSGRHAAAWQSLNEVTGRKISTAVVKLKGSVEERKNQWKDYFTSLLGNPPKVPDDEFILSPVVEHTLPIEVGPFTIEELNNVIKYAKRGGAVGVDCIPLEIWNSPQFITYLLELCNIGLSKHTKPDQWSKSAIKPIPKKATASLVSDHRGISLNTIASKLYNKMLLNRIQPHVDPLLSWTQCGFRKSRSTLSNILALRRIIEGLKDKNLPLALVFIDFSKAFDSIHRDRMFLILKAYGIPPTIIDAIKLIYENSAAQVITPDGETPFFNILAGIFQGDTLAPFLFIVVLDYALKEAFKISDGNCGIVIKPKQGSRSPEIRLKDLAYADDIALINKSLHLAENLLHCVESSARMIGLHLNTGKTEILTSCIEDIQEVKSLSGNVLKQVDHFKYLGAYMPDSSYDFNMRKGLAWAAVNELDCIWKSNMDKKLKVKFFRSCVESILLYNSETWTVTGNLEKQIDGLYTKLLRRILGVRWSDHVTNKELYGDIPLLSATIRQRRMRFAGHCFRADDQPVSKLIFWSSKGKRGRGPGIKTFPKVIGEDTGQTSENEIKVLMGDRNIWRQRVRNVVVSSTDD